MQQEDVLENLVSPKKSENSKLERNLIGGESFIGQRQGALSLVRKFKCKHAYLILEYLDKNNERISMQAHLFIDEETKNKRSPNAKIYYKKLTLKKLIDLSSESSQGKLYSVTWNINVDKMRLFDTIVTEQVARAKAGKIKYSEPGKAPMAGSIGTSLHASKLQACEEWSTMKSRGSVSQYLLKNGHNCYSWAQAVAMQLDVKPPHTWLEFFIKDPTRVLHADKPTKTRPDKQNTSKCQNKNKEKAKVPADLEAIENSAVTTFTKLDHDERNFSTWYSPETIKCLVHSSPNTAKCLRVVFYDSEKEQEGFKIQLQQLIIFSNKLNRPALFISKEPGCPNHWICGMLHGNQVVIVNPVGITQHQNFYTTLLSLAEKNIIGDVFLSDMKLQNDPNGYVSCGPICVELLMQWSNFKDIKADLFDQIKNGKEQSKHQLKYTVVNITSHLPLVLQTLNESNPQDYQSRLTQLRANHLAHLKTMPLLQQLRTKEVINDYWESCLNSPEQILFHQLLFKAVNLLDLNNNPNYQALCDRLNKTLTYQFESTLPKEKPWNRSKANKMISQPTEGGGDCAFHAVFGQWDAEEGQFICTDVALRRRQLADAIRCCLPTDPMFPMVKNAIMNLILENKKVNGEALQAAQKVYIERAKLSDKVITKAWLEFEKVIKKYDSIVDYTEKFIDDYINHYAKAKGQDINAQVLANLRSSFRERFNTCLNEDDESLKHLIFSILELYRAYTYYEQSQTDIDWDTILNNRNIINEYADFIAKPGTWLLPMELQLVAYVFNYTIVLHQVTIAPCVYNSGQTKLVNVYFNGRNHFQHMVNQSRAVKSLPKKALTSRHVSEAVIAKQHSLRSDIVTTKRNKGQIYEALKFHYVTQWHELPRLLLQDPQPIEQCYVHLALVEQPGQHQKEKRLDERKSGNRQQDEEDGSSFAVNMTLRDARLDSYEDIYKPTKPIQVEDIFTADKEALNKTINKILIVGRAGVGKSTLCQHIAYRWGMNELWKPRFNAVYWIKLKFITSIVTRKGLRDREVGIDLNDVKVVAGAIYDYFAAEARIENKKRLAISMEDIRRDLNNTKTLLILDGFDEVASYYKSKKVEHIIEAELLGLILGLKHPSIILTSRPYGVLHDIDFDRTLENLGFSDEQITRYVGNIANQFIKNDADKAEQAATKFCDQLKNNTNLFGIAHIPINLNILCQLRFSKKTNFDFNTETTLTRIYTKMCELLLTYYLREKKEKDILRKSFDNLKKLCACEMEFLERLAFEGLLTGKLLIDAQKVENLERELFYDGDLLKQTLSIGFLKGVGESEDFAERSYYFIHLTFQEFLAALYLVRGLDQEDKGGKYFQQVLTFIEEQKYRPEYRMVFRFASGLLSKDLHEESSSDDELETEEEGTSQSRVNVPFSPALCYFWDAITCSPQDLIGIQKIDFWMSCLEEAKIPHTQDQFDPRIRYQDNLFKELSHWLAKWMKIRRLDGYFKQGWERILAHPGVWQRLNLFERITVGMNNVINEVREKAHIALIDMCAAAPTHVLVDAQLLAGLQSGLGEENWEVRTQAEKTLIALYAAVPQQVLVATEFMKCLKAGLGDEDKWIDLEVERALAVLCNVTPKQVIEDMEWMTGLKAGLGDNESRVRREAQKTLAALCAAAPTYVLADEQLLAGLRAGLGDVNWKVRSTAQEALETLCRASPRQVLADIGLMNGLKAGLRDEALRVRHRALGALFYAVFQTHMLADEQLLAGLRAGLGDEDKNIRCMAYQILLILCATASEFVLQDSDLLKRLKAGLKDKDSDICETAFEGHESLCRGAPEGVLQHSEFLSWLKVGIGDEDWVVRFLAQTELGTLCQEAPEQMLQDPELIAGLKAGVRDENERVRSAAERGLETLCRAAPKAVLQDLDFIGWLKTAVRDGDEDNWVRFAARNGLAALCKVAPKAVLQDSELMTWFKDGVEDEDRHVRCTAQEVLVAICQVAHERVLQDSDFRTWLKDSLNDEYEGVRFTAQISLEFLCRAAPKQVLADTELMTCLKAGLRDNVENVRMAAYFALAALYKAAHKAVLQNSELLLRLNAGVKDKDLSVRFTAFSILIDLCQKSPKHVLQNSDLLQELEVGLDDENDDIGNGAGDSLSALTLLLRATELLALPCERVLIFIKGFYMFHYTSLTITETQLTLQIGSQVSTKAKATSEAEKEKLRFILNFCEVLAKKLDLPLNVFKVFSENRSIVPRMLPRPPAPDMRVTLFFDEPQKQVEQHEKRLNQYCLASQNMRVSKDCWVVSLMRKKEGKNPEHAFLMIEGRTIFELGVLHKIELFIDQTKQTKKLPKLGVTSGFGKVEIRSNGDIPLKKLAEIFYSVNFLKGASFSSRSWQITTFEKDRLLEWAQEEHAREGTAEQVKYFIGGDRSILASLNIGVSRKGHNCFTWAAELLEKLDKLKPNEPQRFKIIDDYKLFARTSDYLRDPKELERRCLMM